MSVSRELTPKQAKVFAFIRSRVKDGAAPTIREIAGHMRFSSTGTVRDYLKALEKKGYLRRRESVSRSLELLRDNPARIPIVAAIPAGSPNTAHEDIRGYLDTSALIPAEAAPGEVFALRVEGDSMVEAGIRDGDIAIIRRQPTAKDGDIVAALLENNEATLKRLRYKKMTPFLEPANKRYRPLYAEFSIIGRLVTIVRKY